MDVQVLLFALLATVCTTLLGYIWFSPLLFGDMWEREIGGGKRMRRDGTTQFMMVLANMLMEFMMAVIFRAFMIYAGLHTASSIFCLGALLYIGFMLPLLAGDLLWGNRSPRLFVIDAGHRLVLMVILCILGSIWQ